MTDAGDPVHDAQRVFRALLDAMARPAQFLVVPHVPDRAPFGPALAAAALTLLDDDAVVWVQDAAGEPARRWLRERCRARLCDDPALADIAIVVDAATMPPLDAFAAGDDLEPESSATVLLDVADAAGPPLIVQGPGIAAPVRLPVALPAAFLSAWNAQRAAYPCGVDVLLFVGDRVAGLPRTAEVGA